ncbi:Inositol-pentakisphosphate 2-kinase [Strongyloides ratti]|uniref:Inositol-pentakisphosphate 2-kinase n=1 Tax=Strongyloides ratti TaxID=34506 RepID=A0A090LHZ9_STRRB|nr:Inositol-pentakisphosphate 2-kinase [Strongyloides ratti]CEF69367.1 Inositol-pentakisphosphate 2-kinase [Strongyloides ratti]
MDKFISPLFSEKYLAKCKVVSFSIYDAHLLSKLPTLPVNLFIKNINELKNQEKYPKELALLKLQLAPQDCTYISALEMLDATEIYVDNSSINKMIQNSPFQSPTITFEIKPKQGFYQVHFNVDNCDTNLNNSLSNMYFPYCNNCVLQLEKWKSQAFAKMYDFCPLDLYSGDKKRMVKAIKSLIDDPHRNMRIFKDGIEIHSNEGQVGKEGLEKSIGELSKYIENNNGVNNNDSKNFSIQPTSIINELLMGQQIDKIGLVEGIKILRQFSLKDRSKFNDICQWTTKNLSSIVESNSNENKLWQYLLAATLKDCSLMISMKLINSTIKDLFSKDLESIVTIYPNASQSYPLHFIYSIKVVDLDPKSPKNLVNSYARFLEGLKLLQLNPSLRISCLQSSTKQSNDS